MQNRELKSSAIEVGQSQSWVVEVYLQLLRVGNRIKDWWECVRERTWVRAVLEAVARMTAISTNAVPPHLDCAPSGAPVSRDDITVVAFNLTW